MLLKTLLAYLRGAGICALDPVLCDDGADGSADAAARRGVPEPCAAGVGD